MTIDTESGTVSCLSIKLSESETNRKWFTAYVNELTFFPTIGTITVNLPCCIFQGKLDYVEYHKIDDKLYQVYFSIDQS